MRVLTPEEKRKVEFWARNSQTAKILSFFDEFPRFFRVPQPLLLGSNNQFEILVTGDSTVNGIRDALRNLDEPFNPSLQHQRFLGGQKREKPENAFSVVYRELRKGFTKTCLLENTGECSKEIVRAHSIQKALFSNHAKNGHVYEFEPFTGSRDTNKNLWPDLIGIKEATTFLGFCNHHDSQIFSSIENVPFQNTAEQIFLHHYRAFAQMFYHKVFKFKIVESVLNDFAKKFDPMELKSLARKVSSNALDADELKQLKLRLDEQLRNKVWSLIEGHAFVGERMPDVLTTNFFAPRKDFHGTIIQDTKSRLPLKWVSFTVTAVNDQAVFLLCGDKGCPILQKLVESFREMPQQTLAIVSYVFCQFENFIILPTWWESLPKNCQQKFVNAFQAHYYRRELPNTTDWKLKETH